MTFVVEKVSLGQAFLPVLWFSPVNIIPPMLHTLLLHAFFSPEGETTKPGKLPKAMLFGIGWELDR